MIKRNILGVEFNCRKINSMKELSRVIDHELLKIRDKNNESKFFFRGISKNDQMFCTLIRMFDNCKDKHFIEKCEIQMLMKLEQNGGGGDNILIT